MGPSALSDQHCDRHPADMVSRTHFWNCAMLLCKGPGSLDNSFQSSSASPASRRNSFTDPGPKPAKWLLKKMKPCLNRLDFSSRAVYHFRIVSPWSLCFSPKFVIERSPTIRKYATLEVASGGAEAYWFSDQTRLTLFFFSSS